jgi:nucleotide-binding universal stress UspA family protein
MTWARLVLLVAWLASGVAIALYMSRRGHALGRWLVLATMGPFLAMLAVAEVDRERDVAPPTVAPERLVRSPTEGPRVLVGVDGSPEAEQAVDAAVDLLGTDIGRLTLATVVEYETALYPDGSAKGAQARHVLARARERVRYEHGLDASTVVLTGEPAHALLERAQQEGDDLLVVGRRGAGRSATLVGRVATRLAQSSPVSVLVTGPPVPVAPDGETHPTEARPRR